MAVTDPIADMLTRIRNAVNARHESVNIPASKLKVELARILAEEGFIESYDLVRSGTPQANIRVKLHYRSRSEPAIAGLKRVSKPGLRVYVGEGGDPQILWRTRSGYDVHISGRHDGAPGVAQRRRRRASLLRVVIRGVRAPLPLASGSRPE